MPPPSALLDREASSPTVPRAPFRSSVPEPDTGLMPRRALDWLPFLWRRVLFPGAAPPLGPLRVRPLLALALLAGLLLYPCVGFHLFEPDEGRYAQIPREMLANGAWLVPTLQGEPYLDKPPLFYWLVMLAYASLGCHDWVARLVPALAMHASVLVSYLLGRRLLGDRAAWWGALLLTASPLFLGMGRLLLLDGLLTLCVTSALLTIHRAQDGPRLQWGWWLTAALTCGLGVLTKGPIALVLVLVPLALHRRLAPAGAPLRWRSWFAFAGVVAAVALPWYAAVCVSQPEFASYFLWKHNVQRFAQPFDHQYPVWFYVPILLAGMLPVTLLAPRWLRYLLADDPAAARRRGPAQGYLLLAGLWCVLFFSLAGSKLPTYVLPAFAPLCLAAGAAVAQAGPQRLRWPRAVVAGCVALMVGSHYVFIPWYAAYRSPMSRPDEVRAACGDPHVPVVCFPRHVDSVAFYLGRADFRAFRSKELGRMLEFLDRHQRVAVLFGHRNSRGALEHHLPPHLRLRDVRPLGLCEMAIVERRETR